jgi:hypothetical protein
MTTTYRLILCAAAAVAAAGAGARAAGRTDPPATGHVLLLDNERTVEGDIERVGDQYRIRRTVGETWVPGDKVLRLCADMEEAYRILRGRANRGDPDECLRLARWCHGHGLPDRALENVEAAVKLDPGHAEARRLLSNLRRAAAAPPAPPAPSAELPEPREMPEVNAEARAAFATKVEPILMNACAGCHAADRGSSFKLARSYDTTSASRLSLQQNLAAVLAQVNLHQPQESKLLLKAVTAHDPQSREAPLSRKQMAAYHTLEDWVQATAAGNPHLRERSPQPAPALADPRPAPPPAQPAAGAAPAPAGFATARPAPEPQPAPADEFDPALFNRASPPDAPKGDPKKP